MKILSGIFLANLLILLPIGAKNPENMLKEYQWKKRIILTWPSDAAALQQQTASQIKSAGDIKERDLIIFRLDAKSTDFTVEKRVVLREKFGVKIGEHVLIGKDGGAKDRQLGVLNFKKWFALIDTMPMRRDEMN